MQILNDGIDLIHIDITLAVFIIAVINIIITMKVNRTIRYSTFLIYSSYIVCTILNTAVYIAFTWYLAIPLGILVTDLTGNWIKKQLITAKEEEEKGGFGLTKGIRIKQIENYILKASPADMNQIRKFKENPVVFSRLMLTVVSNVIALLIFISLTIQ